jgi:hypothetical protein
MKECFLTDKDRSATYDLFYVLYALDMSPYQGGKVTSTTVYESICDFCWSLWHSMSGSLYVTGAGRPIWSASISDELGKFGFYYDWYDGRNYRLDLWFITFWWHA